MQEYEEEHYPNVMKSWHQNWYAIVPMFKFSNTKNEFTEKVSHALYKKQTRPGK